MPRHSRHALRGGLRPRPGAITALLLALTVALLVVTPAPVEASGHQTARASSQYPSYEAGRAIDGIAADGNLWQSRPDDEAPWWEVTFTLGVEEVTIIGISFAGYQGKYYSVPEEIDVSVGTDAALTKATTIRASEMPATGAGYSPQMRYFTIPDGAYGNVVRLDFPKGGQAGGAGNVALGEVVVNESNLARGRPAVASSSQDNNGPERLTNGVIGQHPEMWQMQVTPTPQPESVPTYWQVDLGAVGSLDSIGLAYGGFENKYYGVPVTTVVQVRDNVCEQFVEVARIEETGSPESGAPFLTTVFDYQLRENTTGRYVRLVFPDGNKGPSSLPPNGAALSEVQIDGVPGEPDEAPSEVVTLSSGFGDVTVDLTHPKLTSLRLFDFDGEPSGRSLLSDVGGTREGAYTYLATGDDYAEGRRFSSVNADASCGEQEASVTRDASGDATKVVIRNIVPRNAAGDPAPVVEDWEIAASESESDDPRSLTWTITQRWERDTTVNLSGTPAMFLGPFGFFGRQPPASGDVARVTSTFWYDPTYVQADGPEACPGFYYPWFGEGTSTRNVCQIITEPDTWATFKLWTNSHEGSDLDMAVAGSGHLYRRGHSVAAFNEIGSVVAPSLKFDRMAGDVDVTTLTLTPKDKTRSGYQLDVSIPDETMERSLRDLYGSDLNGGTLTDQKNYNLGNNSEGVNYSGAAWMQGRALAAGVAADDPLSEHPYPLDRAFRGHLEQILATVDEDGLSAFGFFAAGNRAAATDQNLQTIMGVRDYVVNTGDVDFARQALPAVRRILEFHLDRIQPNGLYKAPVAAPAWYYDAVKFSGYNTYYQAFLYKALLDAAELESAAGEPGNAADGRAAAQDLARAINSVLWMPDAPGGARYMDWLDEDGDPATYFIDMVQYPLIAFGIAPPDRAQMVLDTADARMAELTASHGYTRHASLSSLWPQPPSVNVFGFAFGTYMNGGSLLAQTYWEVLARARMGRVDGPWGAARLLQRYAERFEQNSWVGDNAADIQGNMRAGDGEPYLADMMVAPASLVNGLLGIEPSWDELAVQPHLPLDWDGASARIRYKGRLYVVEIRDGDVTVTPSEPSLAIDDDDVTEGDEGTTPVSLPVTLSSSSDEEVTVAYSTEEGTATPVEDYVPESGTVTFRPGETRRNVTVEVVGDAEEEPGGPETFTVQLSDPQGATITDGEGLVTITDDDGGGGGAGPKVSIDGVTRLEGTGDDPTDFAFAVRLSETSTAPVRVEARTEPGSAAADEDYAPESTTVTFVPGDRVETVTVGVVADAIDEPAETFTVRLSNATGATISEPEGVGTIIDDDDGTEGEDDGTEGEDDGTGGEDDGTGGEDGGTGGEDGGTDASPGTSDRDVVSRLAGEGRIQTAIEASREAFADGSVETVVLARADTFPDALAAAPLASEVDGPVLLTGSDFLDADTAVELARLGATKAYLAGGTVALKERVATDLAGLRITTERLGGLNRFGTAGLIADEVIEQGGAVSQVVLARSDDFADALAAGALAMAGRAPILLVTTDDVPSETAAALDRLVASGDTAFVAGGQRAIGASVSAGLAARGLDEQRRAGASRFGTAVALVDEAVAQGAGRNPTVLASGFDFPDALTAGPAAHALGGSLLLVDPAGLDRAPETRDYLTTNRKEIDRVFIAGGTAGVAAGVDEQVRTATADESGARPTIQLSDG